MCPSRRLAALAALGLLCACAGAEERPALLPPEVTIVDVAVTGVERLETALSLTLRVANENPEPLITVGAVYGVSLNGVRAGKALTNRELEVPGPGEATETVELRVENELLLGDLAGLRSATSLDYVLETKLYLAPRHAERVLTSSSAGSLALPAGFASALAPLATLPADPEPRAGDP